MRKNNNFRHEALVYTKYSGVDNKQNSQASLVVEIMSKGLISSKGTF